MRGFVFSFISAFILGNSVLKIAAQNASECPNWAGITGVYSAEGGYLNCCQGYYYSEYNDCLPCPANAVCPGGKAQYNCAEGYHGYYPAMYDDDHFSSYVKSSALSCMFCGSNAIFLQENNSNPRCECIEGLHGDPYSHDGCYDYDNTAAPASVMEVVDASAQLIADCLWFEGNPANGVIDARLDCCVGYFLNDMNDCVSCPQNAVCPGGSSRINADNCAEGCHGFYPPLYSDDVYVYSGYLQESSLVCMFCGVNTVFLQENNTNHRCECMDGYTGEPYSEEGCSVVSNVIETYTGTPSLKPIHHPTAKPSSSLSSPTKSPMKPWTKRPAFNWTKKPVMSPTARPSTVKTRKPKTKKPHSKNLKG